MGEAFSIWGQLLAKLRTATFVVVDTVGDYISKQVEIFKRANLRETALPKWFSSPLKYLSSSRAWVTLIFWIRNFNDSFFFTF